MADYMHGQWEPNTEADSQAVTIRRNGTIIAYANNLPNTQDEYEYGPLLTDKIYTMEVVAFKEVVGSSPAIDSVSTGNPGSEYVAPPNDLNVSIVEH